MIRSLITLVLVSTTLFAGQHEEIMRQCQEKRRAAKVDTNLYGPMVANALDREASSEPLLSSDEDPAGREARRIEAIVSHSRFYNFRGRVQHATWSQDKAFFWDVQNEKNCLDQLDGLGLQYKKIKNCSPIPNPIEIKNGFVLDGIQFSKGKLKALTFSCELMIRLPVLARVLRNNGVVSVEVMSHHRPGTLPGDPAGKKCGTKTTESFHHTGLAIDISAVKLADGRILDLHKDFYEGLNEIEEMKKETCSNILPLSSKARILRKIACDLFVQKTFATILTPNYNCGHKDHYHFDVRPRDDRGFLR